MAGRFSFFCTLTVLLYLKIFRALMKVNLLKLLIKVNSLIFFDTALAKLRGTSDVSEDIEEMRVCYSSNIYFLVL